MEITTMFCSRKTIWTKRLIKIIIQVLICATCNLLHFLLSLIKISSLHVLKFNINHQMNEKISFNAVIKIQLLKFLLKFNLLKICYMKKNLILMNKKKNRNNIFKKHLVFQMLQLKNFFYRNLEVIAMLDMKEMGFIVDF